MFEGVLRLCPSFPESTKIESEKLYEKYRPCELDETLSRKEKSDIMFKWWSEEENLLRFASKQFLFKFEPIKN